ncbi:restriction endonuclease subunit R [Scytonema sp. NUACC26]|uniref:restriction endonuclease subunit R n=1 Tax=Scytonema sp. NUACC26 TaxID=3140176 RepID=UPI0034DC8398
MPITLETSTLSLNDVHRLLKPQKTSKASSFTEHLTLEPLTELEQQDLLRIKNDFRRYFAAGKVSEGLIKFLAIAPLMRLSGFYDVPVRLTMEDAFAISIEDEDTKITGRMDILALSNTQAKTANTFWILVLETKNSSVDVFEGLPQLLTYAFKSLEKQSSVWGLATNGHRYQFVRLEQGNPPIYKLMPLLNLIQSDDSIQLVQVLKAICQLENSVS